MKSPRLPRAIALIIALALVAAACGQKEGVHVASGGRDRPTSAQNLGGIDGPGGQSAAPTTQETAAGSGATRRQSETGRPGPETASEQSEGQGGTQEAGTGPLQAQGSDRTGVSDDAITIAEHAPVTGAAPLPSVTFERMRDLYWRWKAEKGQKTLGRSRVNVGFRDDRYSPSAARQVCRELASESFLLMGTGGTDQIQACGNLATATEFPYLSVGVTERGLGGSPWYFATTMTYKQQGPLLAQYVKRKFPDKKVAMIVTDTPNFDDAVEGWEAAVEDQGIDYAGTLRHPKHDTSWYNSFGNKLKSNGVDVVYMLTAPVDYIQFAQQNEENGGPGFQFVGVGITKGLNAILPTGCNSVDGGIFFSPFPGLDWARDHVPEYFEAARKFEPGVHADDVGLGLWMLAAQTDVMFERYGQTFGNDLTREDFRAMLERQQGMENGIGPALGYTPDDHFGANQVHVLQADCEKGEHVTLQTFATGF